MNDSASSLWARLGNRWSQLKPQEQRGIQLATVLVVGVVLWFTSIGPNLQQLRTANTKGLALDSWNVRRLSSGNDSGRTK